MILPLSHLTGPTYDLLYVGADLHMGMPMCVNLRVGECKGQRLMSGLLLYSSPKLTEEARPSG